MWNQKEGSGIQLNTICAGEWKTKMNEWINSILDIFFHHLFSWSPCISSIWKGKPNSTKDWITAENDAFYSNARNHECRLMRSLVHWIFLKVIFKNMKLVRREKKKLWINYNGGKSKRNIHDIQRHLHEFGSFCSVNVNNDTRRAHIEEMKCER